MGTYSASSQIFFKKGMINLTESDYPLKTKFIIEYKSMNIFMTNHDKSLIFL